MKIDGLIFGGGTGDSAAAVFRLCEGIEPVIREREEVPRSHIDQSLSGRAAPVVRRLGLAEKMDVMANPIRHGGRVYGTNATNSWYVKVSSRAQNTELSDSTTWPSKLLSCSSTRPTTSMTPVPGARSPGTRPPARISALASIKASFRSKRA